MRAVAGSEQIPFHIILSSMIGGFFCILSDISINGKNGSLFINTVENLNVTTTLPIRAGIIILLILLPLLSAGLCFVFEPKSRRMAFYLGASILALIFNFVPQTSLPGLKLEPNSARIEVRLESPVSPKNTEVTVIDLKRQQIIGRTVFYQNCFSFYLDDGNYLIQIVPQGYKIIEEEITIMGEDPVFLGPYRLQQTNQNNNLQGLLW